MLHGFPVHTDPEPYTDPLWQYAERVCLKCVPPRETNDVSCPFCGEPTTTDEAA